MDVREPGLLVYTKSLCLLVPKDQYENIFSGLPGRFYSAAIEQFSRHMEQNTLYAAFAGRFLQKRGMPERLEDIPFLPISFFRTHAVKTGEFEPKLTFESSGTTGMVTSRHLVRDAGLYERSFRMGFGKFYGEPEKYCILGLLPAYLERGGSSLVYMVNDLIAQSGHPLSGFYLYDHNGLQQALRKLEAAGQKTLLIGVSFALLDFAEACPMPLLHTIIMETGGMKGRREEMTREALHDRLCAAFSLDAIHSEYGMTELLSQAYSFGKGIYYPAPWLKPMIRLEDDPTEVRPQGEGLLNLIDLANQDSCCFIATDDLARIYPDGSFEVLGRRDNSDLRGCSLLAL